MQSLPLACLVYILCLVLPVVAKHQDCTWVIDPKRFPPSTHAFCASSPNEQHRYFCRDPNQETPPVEVQVGDWNAINPLRLEIGTPCGGGGYGFNGGSCLGGQWIACIGSTEDPLNTCFGLKSTDDCVWPGDFYTPPPRLSIFYIFPVQASREVFVNQRRV